MEFAIIFITFGDKHYHGSFHSPIYWGGKDNGK